MNVSLLELWDSMGSFAKGIVFVLAIMSLYSLDDRVQKWSRSARRSRRPRKFAPEFSQFLQEDNLDRRDQAGREVQESHVARVLGGALARSSR